MVVEQVPESYLFLTLLLPLRQRPEVRKLLT